MSVCNNCGSPLGEGMKFCASCGTPTAAADITPEPSSAPVSEPDEITGQLPTADSSNTSARPSASDSDEDDRITGPLPTLHPPYTSARPAASRSFTDDEITTPLPTLDSSYTSARPSASPSNKTSGKGYTPPSADAAPPAKSKWEIMSTGGFVGAILLMSIPFVGFILTIIWACGGCRKYVKRNYARAMLIFYLAGFILAVAGALIGWFCFSDEIITAFEALFPGYTIIY